MIRLFFDLDAQAIHPIWYFYLLQAEFHFDLLPHLVYSAKLEMFREIGEYLRFAIAYYFRNQ